MWEVLKSLNWFLKFDISGFSLRDSEQNKLFTEHQE